MIATAAREPLPGQRAMVATIGRSIPFDDYRAIGAVNWSTLKNGLVSMLHYKHALDHPDGDTPARILGRATHAAVFEPAQYPLLYVVQEGEPIDCQSNPGRAWLKEWRAEQPPGADTSPDAFRLARFLEEHPGKTPLTREQNASAWAMGEKLRKNKDAARYLGTGRGEVAIEWVDPETKLPCKARVDWLCDPLTELDLKTSDSIKYGVFRSKAWKLGYFHQRAFTRIGLQTLTGDLPAHRILAVESAEPYDSVVFIPDDDFMFAAEEEVRSLLVKLAHARRTGEWPGQYDGEQVLRGPKWVMAEEEEHRA